jgi:replicative DNA helicase
MAVSFDVDVQNEQVILGALIASAETRKKFVPKLRAESFIDPTHQTLFTALRDLERRGVPYAADTVVQATGDEVKFKYLRDLESGYGALDDRNVEFHIEKLDRDGAKERAREAFETLYASLDDTHAPLEDVEAAAAEILRAVREPTGAGRVRSGKSLREEWFGELEEAAAGRKENFRPLHFSGLDEELYEGAKPGNVIVLAARPGMGKTTFCSNLLMRQTLRGRRCLSVPVEPGTDAVIEQMACARARISAEKVVKAPDSLTRQELFDIKRASREILDSDLIKFDDEMSSFDELESLVSSEDFDLVLIDLWEYLLEDLDPKVVTQALRRLKKLAKKRKFVAVVVHQIKRIKRIKNPRPQLHELKNSGGYEEVADLVLLLHRARYYNPDIERDILEIDVAKQRRGPQNVRVGFEFDPRICRVGKHDPDFDPRDAM